jgi:hypothetical protein
MSGTAVRFAASAVAALLLVAPLSLVQAQSKATEKGASPTLIGGWQGTASVPLKDSTLTVPVLYTFTQTGSVVGGMAMVPGQGSGPISNVVVSGKSVRFVVTATAAPAKPVPGKPAPPAPKPNVLEHDGSFTADGAIEGMVNLDKQPVAKFRIVPSKVAPAKK